MLSSVYSSLREPSRARVWLDRFCDLLGLFPLWIVLVALIGGLVELAFFE